MFSTGFRKVFKYQIQWKSVQCQPSCSVPTDIPKPIAAFRNFANSPTKVSVILLVWPIACNSLLILHTERRSPRICRALTAHRFFGRYCKGWRLGVDDLRVISCWLTHGDYTKTVMQAQISYVKTTVTKLCALHECIKTVANYSICVLRRARPWANEVQVFGLHRSALQSILVFIIVPYRPATSASISLFSYSSLNPIVPSCWLRQRAWRVMPAWSHSDV